MSECKWYGCQLVAEANGYCFKHKIYSGVKVEIPKPAPIKKVSKKQSVINRELGKQLKEWISENKKCEVRSPVCNGKVESTHHLQKRSPNNVLDKKNIIPCCIPCNGYIEQNSDWAKTNGFTISKFKK